MNDTKPDIDQLFRTLMVVWLVMLFSQFALFWVAYALISEKAVENAAYGFLGNNPLVIIGAIVLAVSNLMLSFVIRARGNAQAVAEQNVRHHQTGFIVACALCETVSLIGIVLVAIFAYPFFYYWFALGIAGIFIHFPRRQQLIDATTM